MQKIDKSELSKKKANLTKTAKKGCGCGRSVQKTVMVYNNQKSEEKQPKMI